MQITNLSISATAESHRRAGRELLSPGNFYVLQADLTAEMGGLDDISRHTTAELKRLGKKTGRSAEAVGFITRMQEHSQPTPSPEGRYPAAAVVRPMFADALEHATRHGAATATQPPSNVRGMGASMLARSRRRVHPEQPVAAAVDTQDGKV